MTIVLDGWDINDADIGMAMVRAQVLDVAIQDQVIKQLSCMTPRPSIYDPSFIAENQVNTPYLKICLSSLLEFTLIFHFRLIEQIMSLKERNMNNMSKYELI